MVAFNQHGTPEPTVGFEYPDEPEHSWFPQETASAAQAFRLAIELVSQPRGARARNVRIEALLRIITRSNEPLADVAKRLGVSREHFSREVTKLRRLKPLV